MGKEYIKAVYCQPAYLTYMQSTSYENAGLDDSQAGVKTARSSINNLRYADDTSFMAESKEELKSLLMKVKEESEKAGLKNSTFKILKSWHLAPSLHGKQKGKKWKRWQIFVYFGSKITVDLTAAMKLKDACSLEEKL